jgi:hypothetical protein
MRQGRVQGSRHAFGAVADGAQRGPARRRPWLTNGMFAAVQAAKTYTPDQFEKTRRIMSTSSGRALRKLRQRGLASEKVFLRFEASMRLASATSENAPFRSPMRCKTMPRST